MTTKQPFKNVTTCKRRNFWAFETSKYDRTSALFMLLVNKHKKLLKASTRTALFKEKYKAKPYNLERASHPVPIRAGTFNISRRKRNFFNNFYDLSPSPVFILGWTFCDPVVLHCCRLTSFMPHLLMNWYNFMNGLILDQFVKLP